MKYISIGFAFMSIALEAGCSDRTTIDNRMSSFRLVVYQMCIDETFPSPAICNERGEKLQSWRFFTLPDVITHCDERLFNVSWDSKELGKWFCRRPKEYCFGPTCETGILAITGEGTAMGAACSRRESREVGTSILIVEARNTNVHWMEPVDLELEHIPRVISSTDNGLCIGGHSKDGFLVGFADGEVWLLSHDVPFELLAKFFAIESARNCDREADLGPYRLDVARAF